MYAFVGFNDWLTRGYLAVSRSLYTSYAFSSLPTGFKLNNERKNDNRKNHEVSWNFNLATLLVLVKIGMRKYNMYIYKYIRCRTVHKSFVPISWRLANTWTQRVQSYGFWILTWKFSNNYLLHKSLHKKQESFRTGKVTISLHLYMCLRKLDAHQYYFGINIYWQTIHKNSYIAVRTSENFPYIHTCDVSYRSIVMHWPDY